MDLCRCKKYILTTLCIRCYVNSDVYKELDKRLRKQIAEEAELYQRRLNPEDYEGIEL
jgi:DNA topoisomerase IB